MDLDIFSYAQDFSSAEPPLLAELYRTTQLKTLYPRMVSGAYQGRLLAFLSKLIQPQHILEIGTFTGYGCICLAEGLRPDGRITTLEMNPELGFIIDPYLERAGIKAQVQVMFGKAADIIPNLEGPFDLVFIDADKSNYLTYYHQIWDKVPSGGVIMADNVWWDGKVQDLQVTDKETRGIRTFNEFVTQDERVDHIFLPIRDGLLLLRKR